MATNGNISVSTNFGFGPIQTVFLSNSAIIANTTPSTYESAAVLFLNTMSRVIGDDYTNLTNLAPFMYNSAITTNTTLAESTTVSILANMARVIGDDYTNLTNLTSFTYNSAITTNTTLAESTTVSILATMPRVMGDDYTNLAKLTPSPSITYVYIDGVPIVTGTPSNQQYWN